MSDEKITPETFKELGRAMTEYGEQVAAKMVTFARAMNRSIEDAKRARQTRQRP